MDICRHRRRHPAGQHQLEMALRQAVLPLQEEHPRQLQPHPYQLRTVDQDDAEGGDSLVVQRLAGLVGVRLRRLFQRLHADAEQDGVAFLVAGAQGVSWAVASADRQTHSKKAATRAARKEGRGNSMFRTRFLGLRREMVRGSRQRQGSGGPNDTMKHVQHVGRISEA